jgi:hypothetical protein
MTKQSHGATALPPTKLYGRLMEEAKLRLAAIDAACSGPSGLVAPFVGEFCYLQLRMLCELIALACLVAHGDVPGAEKRNVRKAWAAKSIIDALAELHPPFYPTPVTQVEVTPGEITYSALAPSEYLTKKELVTLSGRCGDLLHRGDIGKVRANGLRFKLAPDVQELQEIATWASKITALLSAHLIALHDEKTIYLCFLRTDQSDRVSIGIGNVLGPIWPHEIEKASAGIT